MKIKSTITIKRSERFKEIVGKPPNKLIFWGLTITVSIVVSFVFLASIIPYPETVEAMAIVYSSEEEAIITSAVSSKVDEYYKKDGEAVSKGDTILTLHRPNGLKHEIQILNNYIRDIERAVDNSISPIELDNIISCELDIFKEDFRKFYLEITSMMDFSQNSLTKPGTSDLIWRQHKGAILLQIDKMKEVIKAEEGKYVITASCNGIVRLLLSSDSTLKIQQGEYLAAIVPGPSRVHCRVAIRPNDFAKIHKEQEVKIKLEKFLAEVYGEIRGIIKQTFPVEVDGLYIAIVELPDGVAFTSGVKPTINSKQSGIAKVIVNERSLLQAFFHKYKTSVKLFE